VHGRRGVGARGGVGSRGVGSRGRGRRGWQQGARAGGGGVAAGSGHLGFFMAHTTLQVCQPGVTSGGVGGAIAAYQSVHASLLRLEDGGCSAANQSHQGMLAYVCGFCFSWRQSLLMLSLLIAAGQQQYQLLHSTRISHVVQGQGSGQLL
jgi:hypothetical protein